MLFLEFLLFLTLQTYQNSNALFNLRLRILLDNRHIDSFYLVLLKMESLEDAIQGFH